MQGCTLRISGCRAVLSGSRGTGLCSQDLRVRACCQDLRVRACCQDLRVRACCQDLGVQDCALRISGCRAVIAGTQDAGLCCQDLRVRASCQDLRVQGWSVWGRLGLLCLSAVRPHVFRVCGLTGPPIPHGRQPLGDSSGLNHLFSQEPLPAGTSWLPARLTTNPS